VVDYKRILRLRAEGISQRGIAEALGHSRKTVASVFTLADGAGVGWAEVASLDSGEVRRLLIPQQTQRSLERMAPDFDEVHRELAKPKVTLLLVWNEYVSKCREAGGVPYQYSFFAEQYRRWAQVAGATLHIHREPGESVQVDWAGDPMIYLDPLDGTQCKAWLFVATLSYSVYTFVEAFADMTLASWIDGHTDAFAFFGGAARLLIPDNLRTGVSRADRYEPALHPTYQAMADHYDTAVIPARIKKPKDKPAVEGSVRHIAGGITAALRNRRFVGLGELNEAIVGQVHMLNAAPFQKRDDSRMIVFLRDEKPLLRPLPSQPFEIAELRTAKVGPNYHVQVQGAFYSVPSRLIGQQVEVCVTSRLVEVHAGGQRVASHAKALRKGFYVTVPEHMPTGHREYLKDWTPERFTSWAATVGPNTVAVIEAIMAAKKVVEQSYRSCLGVMALAKKPGGHTRLEDTCERALALTAHPSYTQVRRMWTDWQAAPPEPASLADKGFVRGADYYASLEGGNS